MCVQNEKNPHNRTASLMAILVNHFFLVFSSLLQKNIDFTDF